MAISIDFASGIHSADKRIRHSDIPLLDHIACSLGYIFYSDVLTYRALVLHPHAINLLVRDPTALNIANTLNT